MVKSAKRLMCIMLAGILALPASIPVYAAQDISYEQSETEKEADTAGESERESELTKNLETDEKSEDETDTEMNEDPLDEDESLSADDESSENMTDVSETQGVDATVNSDTTSSSNLPSIEISASEGNIVVGMPGTYYTETAKTILDRLNEIRLEACREGVPNPNSNTGEALTESDYVPLQWSSDMEAIARLRAAEGDITWGHTRPNGLYCFTIKTSNVVQSWAENLGWNANDSTLMRSIELFYEEKADWVNNTPGAVTGHYTSIIDPSYNYVGTSAFKSTGNYYPATAMEFSNRASLDTYKDSTQGDCVQAMEIKGSQVTELNFDKTNLYIVEGGTATLSLTATIKTEPLIGSPISISGLEVLEAGSFSVSNSNVLTVNKSGEVTALSKGTATITVSAGNQSDSINVTVLGEGELTVVLSQLPTKTTYLVGESLDLSGGSITNTSTGETVNLTSSMVSGFSSDEVGISTVSVSYDGYILSFDTLIVEKPNLTAQYGQTLSQVMLPSSDYGVYFWEDGNQTLNSVGLNICNVSFIPDNTDTFNVLEIEAEINVYYSLENGIMVIFTSDTFIYNGAHHTPKATVSFGKTVLRESIDYQLSYTNNRNAGTAQMTITGMGYYSGTVIKDFEILPASLVIKAKNVRLLAGSPIPEKYEYDITGLVNGDTLITEPTFSCDIQSTEMEGVYDIIPSGAIADSNYSSDIEYKNGTLTVSKNTFYVQEIEDVYYTGSALKPAFEVYDGGTLLKLNKDYKVAYYNNVNANPIDSNGQLNLKEGTATGDDFDETLPYVLVTGKGNYTDSVKINFNILPVKISDNGFTLKYTDQTTINKSKEFKPFKSIKYKKAMKAGTDFDIVLKSVDSYDATGMPVATGTTLDNNAVPKGYSGSFSLTINGIGNYSGSVSKTVYVSDKEHLLKNAKITIGKNLKSIKYESSSVELTPAYYNSENKKYYRVLNGEITQEEIAATDAFTVKCGSNYLIYQKDFTISYLNNEKIGNATLIISGTGEYAGTKSAAFKITGEAFNAKNITVEGLSDKSYTGNEIEQDNLVLTYSKGTEKERQLIYEKDYIISYKKNINKGTASITFTAAEGSYFSGKFNKSFKITATDINTVTKSESMSNISVSYKKAGATPSEQIKLINKSDTKNVELVSGKDYSIKYRNNKAVANASDEKKPTIIIRGKGNYTGTLEIPFTITKATLNNDMVTIKAIAYNPKKTQDYAYKPKVKLLDNNSVLKEKVDYNIEYVNNTQSSYEAYIENPEDITASSYKPIVRITAVEGSNYILENPIKLTLPIYKNKLTKNNIYVIIGEAKYTGQQVTPDVKVYYSDDKKLISKAKDLTDEEQLTNLGLVKLNEASHYTLSYGANITAGKNKGSIKISGLSPYYGGDITIKFTIDSKGIAW